MRSGAAIGSILLIAANAASAQPPPLDTCRTHYTVTGACYWMRGTLSMATDSSTLKPDGPGKAVWIEVPVRNGPFDKAALKLFGPNGEGIHGRFDLCPVISHALPWGNGTGPSLCIETAQDLKTNPFPEAVYRQRPDLRARWQAFLKQHRP